METNEITLREYAVMEEKEGGPKMELENTDTRKYKEGELCWAPFSSAFLKYPCAWMDLEGIMLSKISQTEKDKYCMISLTCGI